jgi:hypothetical protein
VTLLGDRLLTQDATGPVVSCLIRPGAFQSQACLDPLHGMLPLDGKSRRLFNSASKTDDLVSGWIDGDVPAIAVEHVEYFAVTHKTLVERRVFAHVVVDATAKHHDFEAVLFFHAPGLSLWHSHGPNNDLVRYVAASSDDKEYFPKVRGDVDFAAFYAPPTP